MFPKQYLFITNTIVTSFCFFDCTEPCCCNHVSSSFYYISAFCFPYRHILIPWWYNTESIWFLSLTSTWLSSLSCALSATTTTIYNGVIFDIFVSQLVQNLCYHSCRCLPLLLTLTLQIICFKTSAAPIDNLAYFFFFW